MSRVGKKPIQIPDGVKVEISGQKVSVSGPLGNLSWDVIDGIDVRQEENVLYVEKKDAEEDNKLQAFFGLSRALVANMVTGVSTGFERDLEIHGVGYRALQKNQDVELQLGFSHPITFTPPEGITIEVVDPTKIKVKGIDKQKVGQVAANIRELRPPEPYKGKGIRYRDEYVRRKAGKAAK